MGRCTQTVVAELNMKSFVAVLACVASASAVVIPAAGLGYAYPNAYGYTAAAPLAAGYGYAAAPVAYAAQPVAYAHAPVAGVYAGVYDPSVAYANLYPAAEPYVDVQIPAEPYVDAQIEAEPYVHAEIAAEPYVDAQVPAEPYIHTVPAPVAVAAPVIAHAPV